ncbi:FliM/FliN family flagellar motor switch protein [Hippea maritima]|uniref:Flagellar motor switch protein FliN n=1 Tax=Hippea maritima (strain ATCC 700847 / DSM 10411 / MH2) TaxID=760142 RepID=F2LVQ5_HIPMA|nr:FliM/FliN family flagellar motor C-terminal domain-containing protein [Hippea maritima]AEA33839.1 surface presentation of antigens (SPOA) protein [Hippea maritima DSM 10411]
MNPNREKIKKEFEKYFDIPLKMVFDLATTQVKVKDLLKWKEGDIIETNKMAGEYININIENKPLGMGEVIVLDNKFAIRITNIFTKDDLMELNVK